MPAHSSSSLAPERVRLAWGRRGVLSAVARGDALVIVDVLSFSTAVVSAVREGGTVRPCVTRDEAIELSHRHGGAVAVGREDVPERGRLSLSPLSFAGLDPGQKILLPSPNGATCSALAGASPAVFAGALLNAGAVAGAADRFLAGHDAGLTVVACGERWPDDPSGLELRFAVEDYLGAGAILANLEVPLSAEARVAAFAYAQAREDLYHILMECESGQELIERRYTADVAYSAQLDLSDAVPVLQDGWFVRHV